MTPLDRASIAAAVAELRTNARCPLDPRRRGPLPLARFLDECLLLHVQLEQLSRSAIAHYLRSEGIEPGPLDQEPGAADPLAGFLLTLRHKGFVFVGAQEPTQPRKGEPPRWQTTPLGRRRFTVAHELGHFLLHRERMGPWLADTKDSIREGNAPNSAQTLETEANRFAVELLLPAELCQARADEFRRTYHTCPRHGLAYHLASELLVSPEALRYRLEELELGDET